ncbi:hypothetical protein FB45DRAFT_1067639 [Roridomyces roridus]|uniref:FAD-binding domain-containing protein n=1 Tax=Roridomyces roridus TaxID=1738132 RepID=A0AAD7B2I3_9AGAR|nr:hypothetical protein FB45DRAFT_1067639 [Roridomyces roridus]
MAPAPPSPPPTLEPSSSPLPLSTLRIAIIGAGMAGLATALALAGAGFTEIDVYESAPGIEFVGAGIQIAANLSKQLENLGVWERMQAEVVETREVSIRGGYTDEELSYVDLRHNTARYGRPHRVAHRSALANALYEGCLKFNGRVKFHFQTSVLGIDLNSALTPRILIREGKDTRWIDQVDLVLGADGVKSVVRASMLAQHGEQDKTKDTGEAAYRIMINREKLSTDPDLLALLDGNCTSRWVAAGCQIIAYPISSHNILNIVTTQPDTNFASAPTASWTTRGSKSAMQSVFADFCPRIRRLLSLVPEGEVCEWKLRVHAPLKTWVDGCVALLGDACHPALPHLGQGAAQAIEDGVVLAFVLSKLTRDTDVPLGLKVYEHLRKQRAERLVEEAESAGRNLMLADSKAQAARDEALRRVKNGGENPDKWVDRAVTDYIYGFDCLKDAEERFAGLMGI